jgi:hypothetical protein
MNEITVRDRTYRVGGKNTPIVKWSWDDERAYVLKPEGFYIVDLKHRFITMVFDLTDKDREKMIPDGVMTTYR